LEQILERTIRELEVKTPDRPVEVAFFGGTFTALPLKWMERFLDTAAAFRQRGVVTGVRCSTRPDAVTPELLSRLAGMGLSGVEFGAQTFDDAVLATARRGHTGDQSLSACNMSRQAGLSVTLQLLPGLPGHTPGHLAKDISLCLEAGPDAVRLHPCLVLAGTGLEPLWRAGEFTPWPLSVTVEELARAVLALWRGGIAVSRIGLAQEPLLEEAVLAGPRHSALGTMVRARALLLDVTDRLAGRKAVSLAAPQALSGEFWGHAGELAPEYAALGLPRGAVRFHQGDHFEMDVTDNG